MKYFLPVLLAGALLFAQRANAFDQKITVPDTLTVQQVHQLDSLENVIKVEQCCNATLAACLKKKNPCELAARLHAFVKWLVARRTESARITDEASKRYVSLTSTIKGTVDTTVFTIAGDPKAPVLISGYVSAVCPICHFVTHELYDAVTAGELKGKARLMVKPVGEGFANKSLAAACIMGRFWDYFVAISMVKSRIEKETIYNIADSLKLDVAKFKSLVNGPQADSLVKASSAEAGMNAVTVTPIYFINRVRYASYKDPAWLVDAVECIYDEGLKKKK
ncbi:MAG TPA: thioredoxin domain-containing protein [Chitinivibrionales bacterium]|nr:thioredoxin domain-containing protein [Chitinivibrionales bacterium]